MEIWFFAAVERSAADACHVVAKSDFCQACAAVERIIANACHAIPNSIIFDAISKYCLAIFCFVTGIHHMIAVDCNIFKSCTARERTAADACHAAGNCNTCQACTLVERIAANSCYGKIYNSLEIILLPHFEWQLGNDLETS